MKNTAQKIHSVKCWSKYFAEHVNGTKSFELRLNDRDYSAGDLLQLEEYNPARRMYTGLSLQFTITGVSAPDFGILPGFVLLSLSKPRGCSNERPKNDNIYRFRRVFTFEIYQTSKDFLIQNTFGSLSPAVTIQRLDYLRAQLLTESIKLENQSNKNPKHEIA